ncbi:MAG TPA: trypsin-like peptidase domain-containing protein [Thermomicrobiaceae bacterium]|nr:trypsin-like peptidase domain-containing protein [Thermomicrobiaceae bacterium]
MSAIFAGALAPFSAALAALAEAARASVVHIQDGQRGGGSGVAWPGGFIVTNHHVAEHESADVTAPDGAEARLPVVTHDEANDLAVLRLHGPIAQHLTPAAIADARELRVGQLVVAVGHPFGVPHAATAGIISALPDWEAPRELLRSDLHLNPGNSGGPLLDAEGRVVGINAMVGGPGTALSIPSHAVQALLARLGGEVPRLGLQVIGLPQTGGLLISGIDPGSPAERAGLLPGDLLLDFGSPLRLRDHLALAQPGATLPLRLSRAGRRIELTVQLPQPRRAAA